MAGDASDAAAAADSAMEAERGAMETDAPRAETDGEMAVDKTERRATTTDVDATRERTSADDAASTGVTGAEAMGGVRTPSGATRAGDATGRSPGVTARLDLSTDQVRRLQTALNDAGCNAGTADGVVGRQTRQAIACGLEKNDLRSNDMKGLYRALGLDFD